MDISRIKALGKSRTSKAWVTNPLRAILWRLTMPYFQGMAAEVDQRQHVGLDSLRQEFVSAAASHLAGLASQRHELSTVIASHLAGLTSQQQELSTATASHLARLTSQQQELSTATASHLAGSRKDALAMAHRLAGLEEEAAANEQAGKALNEAVSVAAAQAREAIAYTSALQEEVRVSIQTLNERVDSLACGAPLRVGERVSVGRGGLAVVATAAHSQFLVRQHDLIGRLVADGREWEPHVREVIERTAQPDGVAIDAGAYIGLHTVTMSRCYGSVYAFEPQRGIFQVLCGNLALNGCMNVTAHNLALYDHAGSMRLAPPERQEVSTPLVDGELDYAHIANAAALTFEVASDGSGRVSAVALDDLALDRVTLIKVDTQGADLRVLRGAEGTIRRCRPSVLFEWERDLGAQHGSILEDYHAFFAALNYDVAVLHETSPGRQADYLATPR